MTRKIRGTSLIGFADFFESGVVVGAGVQVPKTKSSSKGGPKNIAANVSTGGKGKPPKIFTFPKPPLTKGVKTHGVVLQKAKSTINTGVQVLSKAAQALKASPTKALAVAAKKTAMGAQVAAAQGKLSPQAQMALSKQQTAAKKAATATATLKKHVVASHGSLTTLAKHAVAQKKTSLALRTPPKHRATKVGHLMSDPVIGQAVSAMLNDFYTVVGADPDPNNPGFLTDGTPDPAYGAAPADPTATSPVDTSGLSDTTDPVDSGADLPPPPPMDYFFTADQAKAAGAIYYNGERGYPAGYAGSYNLWTRKTDSSAGVPKTSGIDPVDHFGYVWGEAWDVKVPGGLPFGDDLAKDQWNGVQGRHILLSSKVGGPTTPDDVRQHNTQSTNPTNPEGVPYGPIVGNPNMPDFAAMRFDDQLQPFYLPQEAPDWLLFPLKQAAALTAQANAKAAADAQAAQQAALAKTQADAQLAQAQQDAQNQLAESAAQSQANVAQAQAESDAQAALVQQQQADTSAQQLETEQAKQAGDLMLQQAQREQQYLAQHPELEFPAQSQVQAVPPGYVPTDDGATPYDDGTGDTAMPGMSDFDTGGGEGKYPDGSPIPGADMMLDQDGEGADGSDVLADDSE